MESTWVSPRRSSVLGSRRAKVRTKAPPQPSHFISEWGAYLRAPRPEREAAAATFWAAFGEFWSCYQTYAPIFIQRLEDEAIPPSLSSYFLFRQKLHTCLEAGPGVSAPVAETRAAWAAHVICYEQHLRAMMLAHCNCVQFIFLHTL